MDGMENPERGLEGVLQSVGPRLRSLRQDRGATLAQLSEATGISVSTCGRRPCGEQPS